MLMMRQMEWANRLPGNSTHPTAPAPGPLFGFWEMCVKESPSLWEGEGGGGGGPVTSNWDSPHSLAPKNGWPEYFIISN